MTRAHLQPAPGGLVRHPRTRRPLAAEGEEVTLDSFWRRRLRRGDVIMVGNKIPPPKAPKATQRKA
jgi:hypothetical protein